MRARAHECSCAPIVLPNILEGVDRGFRRGTPRLYMALCGLLETDLAEWKDNCIFAVGAVCAVAATIDKAHKTLHKRENQPAQSGLETGNAACNTLRHRTTYYCVRSL